MKTTIKQEDSMTTVTLEGRLDTTNSQDFANQIDSLFSLVSPNIVFECSAFDYISSSGLRVLLTLQKSVTAKKGKLVFRHIQPDIQEVFNITGFSSIFDIEG